MKRTLGKPLTSDFANDLHRRDAVHRSSEPLKTVQRSWERPAAPDLLPHRPHNAPRGPRTTPAFEARRGDVGTLTGNSDGHEPATLTLR